MDCDLPLKSVYGFMNHIGQMHVSWIKFKIEDNVQICLCIKCDLTYECENEFNEHYNRMHIEDHHEANLEPTIEEDNKHEVVVGDTEVKDDSSTQP